MRVKMSKIGRVIIAINYFSLGLFVPVMNLVLISRGATLKTLPLLLACYSVTVLLFELPSGVCADLFGRKAVFLLSCIFQFFSFLMFFLPNNTVLLLFAVILTGLSRAFSSGSLDALLIDQTLESQGESALAKITSSLAVIEGCGLSLGGITGGFLAVLGKDYNINILSRMSLTSVVFVLCYLFIKEKGDKKGKIRVGREISENGEISKVSHRMSIPEEKAETGMQTWFKKAIGLDSSIRLNSMLWLILAGTFFTGIFLSFTETYWQSAFKAIDSANSSTWLLGVISFLGFAADTVGNILIGKILVKVKNGWWKVFYISRLLLGIFILFFALQQNRFGFIFGYFVVYFILGTGSVTESTLMNKLIPNKLRSSFLSLSSLILQIGFFLAAFLSSILVDRLHFSGLWLLSGGLIAGYGLVVMGILMGKKKIWDTMEMQVSGKMEKELLPTGQQITENSEVQSEMIQGNYRIQSISPDNREEINKIIQNQWFSTDMVIRGEVVDLTKLDGYAMYDGEKIIGLITYRMTDQDCEITSFDSFRENQGIGTKILQKVIETAKSKNCRRMKLITTNDNINAIRYYQKRGFDMTNLYYNAIEQSRILKPSIPLLGDFNIPIRHEIEFQMQL